MIKVGIVGCGFVGGALKAWLEENNPEYVNAFAKMTQGTPLGTLLAPLHELNVHFRGVEEHI
jgi:predicted dinucleotide-utilizing enzyme